jgi:hypothetical protein
MNPPRPPDYAACLVAWEGKRSSDWGTMPDDRITIRMGVIKKPADGTRSVIMGEVAPMMRGEEDAGIDQVCGGCRTVLIKGLPIGQVRNVVFRCPKCGAYNETEVS